jgi:hypothetical protein
VCADQVGVGGHAGGHGLYRATALGATQVEATTDGRERTGRTEPRRGGPEAGADAPRVIGGGSSQPSEACTPASLLGLSGHLATAPPLQA